MMEFEIVGNEAVLVRYTGTWTKVRVPGRYQDYPVSLIGKSAFEGANLEELEIPSSVRVIGERAFCDCRNLRFISGHEYANREYQVSCFFDDIKIGRQAFCGTGVKDVIFMGGGVEIDAQAFEHCENLTNVVFSTDCHRVKLGNGTFRHSGISSFFLPDHIRLEALPAEIFANCANLENVAFRAGHILRDAFLNCVSLRAVPLSEGLTALIYPVFSGCGVRKLKLPASLRMVEACFLKGSCVAELEVAQEHPHLYTAEKALLIDKRYGAVVACAPAADGSISVPKGITSILPEAFAGSKVCTVDLDEATWIGERAFWGSAIESISLPRLDHCGDEAFADCQQLRLVETAAQVIDFDRWFHDSPIDTIYYYGSKNSYLKYVKDSPATRYARLFLLGDDGAFFRFGVKKRNLMFDFLDHRSEITVTRIAGRFPHLAIPAMLDGKSVTGLGRNCVPAITEALFLPDTIEDVDKAAFVHASNLQRLSIPAGLYIDASCLPEGCVIHHRD